MKRRIAYKIAANLMHHKRCHYTLNQVQQAQRIIRRDFDRGSPRWRRKARQIVFDSLWASLDAYASALKILADVTTEAASAIMKFNEIAQEIK